MMADDENQSPEEEATPEAPAPEAVEGEAESPAEEVVDAAPEGEAEASGEAGEEPSGETGAEEAVSEDGTVELQHDVDESFPDAVVLERLNEMDDVELEFNAMLGSVHITMEQFLKLGRGAIIELDQHKDDLVNIEINGKFFAKGDVMVVDETIAVIMSDVKDIHALAGGDAMGDDMDMAALMEGDDPMAAAMGDDPMAAAMEDDPMAAAMGDDPMAAAMEETDGGGE